jgi:hypothetical protein
VLWGIWMFLPRLVPGKVARMSRAWFAWMILGLAALVATGCTMCCHPYDECGPTFTGGCPDQCSSLVRAGSILSGPAYVPSERPAPPPAPGQVKPLSPSNTPSLEPAPEEKQPAPSGTWKSAKPSSASLRSIPTDGRSY